LGHFVKVSPSYEAGLFHCDDVMDLERTNNDLEQVFGSMRHHERRVSGRKQGSPSLVLRGAVRLVAMLATKLEQIAPEELAPRDPEQCRRQRDELRRRSRARQTRFRRDPDAFLRHLEGLLDQTGLPASKKCATGGETTTMGLHSPRTYLQSRWPTDTPLSTWEMQTTSNGRALSDTKSRVIWPESGTPAAPSAVRQCRQR
jgi:hypothetical protein